MKLARDGSTWTVEPSEKELENRPDFVEAFPRYLTILEPIFSRAQETHEFEFVHALLGIKSMQDAGWVPYETTVAGVEAATELHNQASNRTAACRRRSVRGRLIQHPVLDRRRAPVIASSDSPLRLRNR